MSGIGRMRHCKREFRVISINAVRLPPLLFVFLSFGKPESSVVDDKSDIGISLLYQVIGLGSFDTILKYNAIGQGAFQRVDSKTYGYSLVLDLLSVDLEIGGSVIQACLEIA